MNHQIIETKPVSLIFKKSDEKKGRPKTGLIVHKLLKNSIEEMSLLASEQKFMKTQLVKIILNIS